ncbi:hypothetical protein L209DRAFT_582040 [Thermothelomyces heterothallicus CBS 203.75]
MGEAWGVSRRICGFFFWGGGGGFGTFSRHTMSVFVFWFLQMHFCSGLRRRKLGCTSVE